MVSKRFLITYLVLIAILGTIFWFAEGAFPPNLASAETFKIIPGQSVFNIARTLDQEHVISSPAVFIFYSIISGHYGGFKSGTYIVDSPLGVKQVIDMLVAGPKDVSVVIIPGMTLREIDQELSSKGIIESGTLENISPQSLATRYPFLSGAKNLEGFLMPDTYEFKPGSDTQVVVSAILDNFSKKMSLVSLKNQSLYRTLIIASLLEKEVVSDKDKRTVAGVIGNRLADGMSLQIDATVIYAVCGGEFTSCRPLTESDFSVDSPYNTYKYRGLPPTPIANPAVSSILAAASPQKTNYLYYLSDPVTGETVFSATLNDHAQNREKYLKL